MTNVWLGSEAFECIFRVSKTKRSEVMPDRRPVSEGHSVPRVHSNGIQEVANTTRFYVPSVSASVRSECPQSSKAVTDVGRDGTSSHKLYIPEVFSSR